MKITDEIRDRIQSGKIPMGKTLGESNDVYHATPAISASKLKVARKSLRQFKRRYLSGPVEPSEPSEAMILGSAVHALIEGADAFGAQFALVPENAPKRPSSAQLKAKNPSVETISAIRWWDQFNQGIGARRVLKPEMVQEARDMADAIRAHPAASALLLDTQREVTWRTEVTGLLVQCRTDIWGETPVEVPFADGLRTVGARVVDIKKTATLDPEEYSSFQRQFWSLGYYRQVGFYSALLQMLVPTELRPTSGWIPFYFIAVAEDTHDVMVVEPDANALALGYEHAMADLKKLREAFRTDEWPGTPDTVVPISLPEWFVRKNGGEF